MIHGVHAKVLALIDFERAASLLQVPGWSWLGRDDQFSTRLVTLSGTPPRECRLRVTRVNLRNQAVTSTVQVEAREGTPGTPLLRGEVSLAPASDGHAANRCMLSLQGLAARNLADSVGPASAEASRRLANAYARSLLEQMAGSLESVAGNGKGG